MLKTKIIVNVSDLKVSGNPADDLITYSLGSCIAVCMYDRSAHIGGMLHFQLPDSKIDPQRSAREPLMFADTGMKTLVDKLVSLGANRKKMQIKIAGGAKMDTGPKGFEIGKRNHLAIKKVLWRNGMFIDAEDVGGSSPRNMEMDISDGTVTIESNGSKKQL